MKHNHDHQTAHRDAPRLVPVHFEFNHPSATSVCVAGSFNDWDPAAKALHHVGGGRWLKDTALAPGTYEYRLVVDGQWLADPRVEETVANPYGGRNSVLKVAAPSEAAHQINAEMSPPKSADKQKAQTT